VFDGVEFYIADAESGPSRNIYDIISERWDLRSAADVRAAKKYPAIFGSGEKRERRFVSGVKPNAGI
jgi:hypothetical protein